MPFFGLMIFPGPRMLIGISVFSHGKTSYFNNISVRTNLISNSANRLPIIENCN
jgi:hypothetical protein